MIGHGRLVYRFIPPPHLPNFQKYLFDLNLTNNISIEKRLEAIAAFEQKSQLIQVSTKISACRDPKDDKFLELAIESGASCIVTGDNDLLVLNPFETIPILTAKDFLDKF